MNNVFTVRVILLTFIAVVIFVLHGTCISIAEGYCQVPDPYVCTDQLGFVKGNGPFLVFDLLNSHRKSNFFCKEPDPTVFIRCLEAGFIDGPGEISKGDVTLTR